MPGSPPRPDHRRSPTALTPTDRLRRRRHLDLLLDTRSRLGALASERRSHDLDDAGETFCLMLAIEAEIRASFPKVFDSRFAAWVAADVAAEHPRGNLSPDCGICRVLAQSAEVNLDPPEAA